MSSLWFIIPAHGRVELARVCLAQIAAACEEITRSGIPSSAVVVASDENLETATNLGFATVERDNAQLGRKLNDGYQLAGKTGVDFVAPLGSDDWIDPQLILSAPLPSEDTMRCCRLSAVVNEDASRLARLRIPYDGGDGVRITPTAMLSKVGYRPANEDAKRALDTSVWQHLRPRIEYHDLHPLQIVDWKTSENLNDYEGCVAKFAEDETTDVFEELAQVYGAESINAMRVLHCSPVAA